MENWLRCKLYPGQFTSELAAVVTAHDGREYSLFVQKTDLEYKDEPTGTTAQDGWLRVEVLDKEKNRYLVRLPQSTLENGQYLTVSVGQLKTAPGKITA